MHVVLNWVMLGYATGCLLLAICYLLDDAPKNRSTARTAGWLIVLWPIMMPVVIWLMMTEEGG